MNTLNIKDKLAEFLLYTTQSSDIKVEIFMHNKSVWFPQKRMAELFALDVSTINGHLKNIYKSQELEESATIGKFPIVQMEGKLEQEYSMRKIGKTDFSSKLTEILKG